MSNKLPFCITLSLASAQEAIEYWLNNIVMRENVEISEIRYDKQSNVFEVIFKVNND